MTKQQTTDWLDGKWIAIQPRATRIFYVRRLRNGQVVQHGTTFATEGKAQKFADKLNGKEKA